MTEDEQVEAVFYEERRQYLDFVPAMLRIAVDEGMRVASWVGSDEEWHRCWSIVPAAWDGECAWIRPLRARGKPPCVDCLFLKHEIGHHREARERNAVGLFNYGLDEMLAGGPDDREKAVESDLKAGKLEPELLN